MMKADNSINALLQKCMSRWRMFLVLIAACCIAAWSYTRLLLPLYEATATILIRQESPEMKGASSLESFGMLAPIKNVENEIEIIQSRSLMRKVVLGLHLYAPIFEEGDVRTINAYSTAPVSISVQDPDAVDWTDDIYFSVDSVQRQVIIGAIRYPMDKWVNSPYGVIRFSATPNMAAYAGQSYFFRLIPVKNVVKDLRDALDVAALNRSSSILMLSIRDEDGKRAEDILNLLNVEYGKASIEDKSALSSNTLAFVEERIALVERELDSLENRIRSFKSQKGIVDLSSQGKMFLESLSMSDQRMADLNTQVAVLDQVERYVVSKDNRGGIVPSTLGVKDPILTGLLEKLYESETKYEKLRKTIPENNPLVTTVKSEMEKIRPSLLENIQNQKASLRASIGNVNANNRSYSSMLRSIPQKEKELLDYTRQQAIKNSVYTYLLQKREETALANSATIADNRIVDTAEAVPVPNGPSKPVTYILAVLFGILVGLAVIKFSEFFSTRFASRQEIEAATSYPILAELISIKDPESIAIDKPRNGILFEQFRQLRASMGIFGKVRNKRLVLVTSSISGEGKSFISGNLAVSLAMSGKKVVLIDLDLRNPNISRVFKQSESRGVADYLEGGLEPYEIIRETTYNNLVLVPAGDGDVINTVELLMNGKLEQLLDYLLQNFDYVVMDSSPVDLVADAYVLSDYVDCTLFVVRQNYTPKQLLQVQDEHKKLKRLKNLAIVLNGIKANGHLYKNYGYGRASHYSQVKTKTDTKLL